MALGVLAVCFALSVLGRGLNESFTVFLKPISSSFGWDRAEVVSVYSLSALAGGLASPLIGRLFDQYGPRTVYALGLSLLGGAFVRARGDGSFLPVVLVTNEVGLGVVPVERSGRLFRDLLGTVNQRVAEACDEVHLVVAGRVLKL